MGRVSFDEDLFRPWRTYHVTANTNARSRSAPQLKDQPFTSHLSTESSKDRIPCKSETDRGSVGGGGPPPSHCFWQVD